MTDRDPIYVALYARVKNKLESLLPGFVKTVGRKHMMPPTLTPDKQPAVFVVQGPEHKEPHPRGTSGKLMLHAFILAYCYETTPAQDGTTQLNTLIKSIEQAIEADDADSGGIQTLGGLVYQCWIEGDIDVDPGVFGQQAVAMIPVKMLVPVGGVNAGLNP